MFTPFFNSFPHFGTSRGKQSEISPSHPAGRALVLWKSLYTWCSLIVIPFIQAHILMYKYGLDELKKEWDNYIEEQSVVGRALKTATTHFEYLEGRRRKALDKKFSNVKDLETQLDKNPEKAIDVSVIENVVDNDVPKSFPDEQEESQRQMTLDN